MYISFPASSSLLSCLLESFLSCLLPVLPPESLLSCFPAILIPTFSCPAWLSLSCPESLLSCLLPVLPLSCPASFLSCLFPVLPPFCPAFFRSCLLPFLSHSCSASFLSCLFRALSPSCPALALARVSILDTYSLECCDKYCLVFFYLVPRAVERLFQICRAIRKLRARKGLHAFFYRFTF